uniref:Uncharacterized protein n=1 Tax=Picea glauca TaxID=3330 RepID=A0A101M4M6_PICGL|nr:hypothetical protein ABT39_MTgene865 [Picea glauca]
MDERLRSSPLWSSVKTLTHEWMSDFVPLFSVLQILPFQTLWLGLPYLVDSSLNTAPMLWAWTIRS